MAEDRDWRILQSWRLTPRLALGPDDDEGRATGDADFGGLAACALDSSRFRVTASASCCSAASCALAVSRARSAACAAACNPAAVARAVASRVSCSFSARVSARICSCTVSSSARACSPAARRSAASPRRAKWRNADRSISWFRRGSEHDRGSSTVTSDLMEKPFAGFEPVADRRDGIPKLCCRGWRTTGTTLFGKAAWYNFVGKQTASGEILDTVTATAAHRSLPLASYAKVTNLGNGHSVVVKINDRGRYTRGRILDLSPRAADTDMKRAGVAAVAVEPVATQAGPNVAAFLTSDTALSQ